MSEYVTKPLGERVAALEADNAFIKAQNVEIIEKLDELIALKNKGAGAFVLASAFFGTSFLAAAYYVLELLHIKH